MKQTTIVAEMAPDTKGGPCGCIVEHVAEFGQFVDLVLAFRRDADCVRLMWHDMPEPPDALARHVEQVYRQTQRGRQTGCSPAAARRRADWCGAAPIAGKKPARWVYQRWA